MATKKAEQTPRFFSIVKESEPAFPLTVQLLKAGLDASKEMSSRQGRVPGRREHPIDFAKASALQLTNTTHQTCIKTKRDSTVGLGFETDADKKKKQSKLDPTAPIP